MSSEHENLTHESHSPRRILQACREISSGDAGIRTELDFVRQMSWILVLGLLDARERESKGRESIIQAPYRWRDWANDPEGWKGNELLDFLEGEEVPLPDGGQGPGLFAALRSLQGNDAGDLRDVVAQMFAAVSNRMVDGYLLRDVLGLVNQINFRSAARVRQLADVYEEMLEGVRNEWTDQGTIHTPRALADLVVKILRPRAHEVVLDPACGDGGFLHAAREETANDPAESEGFVDVAVGVRVEGSEPNPLAYLLGATNVLLHGAETPAVYNEDALAVRLSESGHDRRVDVILGTLPRGDVETGVASAFPRDMQTSDAALLHLQLALRRLRRPNNGSTEGGRAALVVPDHVLSIDGAGSRIRARLLEEANLHTIVRLPPGVFEPSTDVATSILFFDRGRPTDEIWYYAHPLPDHRRSVKHPRYTRARQLHFEEFLPLIEWWDRRTENEFAWKVPVREVLEYDERGEVARCDLDVTRCATQPFAPGLEPDNSALRVRVPPVISRPDLMGHGRRAASSALFLLTWTLWVFAWLPAITALAWYFGIRLFRDKVGTEDTSSLLNFLRFYGTVVGIAAVSMLLWSIYNKWFFGGRPNRRQTDEPLPQAELARDFGIEPEMLERVQSSRIVDIDISPIGTILNARSTWPVLRHDPASEAWNKKPSQHEAVTRVAPRLLDRSEDWSDADGLNGKET